MLTPLQALIMRFEYDPDVEPSFSVLNSYDLAGTPATLKPRSAVKLAPSFTTTPHIKPGSRSVGAIHEWACAYVSLVALGV
jgi:hypothetical protein